MEKQMTTKELFNELKGNLPLRLGKNELFHQKIKEEYKSYLNKLKKLKPLEFKDETGHPLDSIIETEKEITKKIGHCPKFCVNGNRIQL